MRERFLQQASAAHLSADSISRQLSAFSLDLSYTLQSYIQEYYQGNLYALLGELQLSFVLFIFLYSFSALQQWQHLVYLICNSECVLLGKPVGSGLPLQEGIPAECSKQTNIVLATLFMRVLYEQLTYLPDDFFVSELT